MAYFKPAQKYQTKKDNAPHFMPFGSLCNMYGQLNQGKGITIEELNEVADKLLEKAKELVKQEDSEDSNDITVQPIKPLGATQPLINDIEL